MRLPIAPGTRLDRYEVLGELGRGGVAVVLEVRDTESGVHRACKVLTVQHPALVERALREARLLAPLRHPNLIALVDVIDLDGSPVLVHELVRGQTLEDWLEAGGGSLEARDAIARGLLSGLAAAHAAGLLHRDIKPANVFVDAALVPRLGDFGLVKDVLQRGPGSTDTGVSMGTPPYMAPEQIQSARRCDARADVFAAGATLFELLHGRRAFPATDTFGVFGQIVRGEHAPFDAGLPERMVHAIREALRPEREQRPADGGALLELWTG